jgi:hypothetical protein
MDARYSLLLTDSSRHCNDFDKAGASNALLRSPQTESRARTPYYVRSVKEEGESIVHKKDKCGGAIPVTGAQILCRSLNTPGDRRTFQSLIERREPAWRRFGFQFFDFNNNFNFGVHLVHFVFLFSYLSLWERSARPAPGEGGLQPQTCVIGIHGFLLPN